MTDWDSLDDGKYRDEAAVIADLLAAQPLSAEDRAAVRAEAEALVRGARRSVRKQGVVESFLQEFSLGTREGLALMCLAEALLRTPDDDTRDKLIAEKIGSADWASHLGGSDSLYLGVDANRIGGNHLYFNVNGYWESSAISGAIMIRPIVGPIIPTKVPQVKAELRQWAVYPNPVEDILNFEVFNYNKPIRYTITTIDGSVVLKGGITETKAINISALIPGMYFVNLQGAGLDTTPKKIIKL